MRVSLFSILMLIAFIHLFPWFNTQWFSSGKITKRVGTFNLKKKTRNSVIKLQVMCDILWDAL